MNFSIMKLASGLFAAYGTESQELAVRVKTGQLLSGNFTKTRNPLFHRKVMALFTLAFETWEEIAPPVMYCGERVLPNFDRTRKDLTILAGFSETTFRLDGSIRVEAKSISFASMDEIEFEALFQKLIQVVLDRIYARTNMTEADLRAAVDRVLAFD